MQMKIRSQRRDNRIALALLSILLLTASACSRSKVRASAPGTQEGSALTVGVTTVTVKPISRQLTISSELVPFQEIDVYAKESGYVRDINVDYGSRVKKGDVMAILEIPELEQLIAQDSAAIQKATDQVTHAQKEVEPLPRRNTMWRICNIPG